VVAKHPAPIYGWLALQAIRFLHIGDGGTGIPFNLGGCSPVNDEGLPATVATFT